MVTKAGILMAPGDTKHYDSSPVWLAGAIDRALARLAAHHGVSPAGVALACLRRLPGSPVPVIGTLDPARITTLRDEAELSLSRQEWYALLEAARGHEVA